MTSRLENMPLKEYIRLRNKLVEAARRYQNLTDKELTVRTAAKNLKIKQQEVIDLVEDCEVLDLIVGVRVGGLGGMIGSYDTVGDYGVEFVG